MLPHYYVPCNLYGVVSSPDVPAADETATGTDFAVSITDVQRTQSIGGVRDRNITAGEGAELLVIEFTFENRGEEVGVTLHHPHGQIYALPFVPPVLAQASRAFRDAPVLARLMERMGDAYEIAGRKRMSAFVPPFARYPYEVWVAPRRRLPGPWTFDDRDMTEFADLLGEVVARFDGLFDRPFPYIMVLQAAPKGEEETFHFHVEFYPPLRTADRLKYLAGIEQGAGTFLVDALPEETAARLRAVPVAWEPLP